MSSLTATNIVGKAVSILALILGLKLIVVCGYLTLISKLRPLAQSRKFHGELLLQLSPVDYSRLLRVVGSPVLVVLPDKEISGNKFKFNNTVHLIGVSHGSPPSAKLVRDTLVDLKVSSDNSSSSKVWPNNALNMKSPVVIALELCDDRYLSIALESKIEPRADNETLKELYQKKRLSIEQKISANLGIKSIKDNNIEKLLYNFKSFIELVKSQGVLLGLFVGLGILVKEMQSMFHSNTRISSSVDPALKLDSNSLDLIPFPGDDEFVTAMRIANVFDYPVRMSDAPQSETLENIKRVASLDIFNPQIVADGAQSLAFSALGLSLEGKTLSSQSSAAARKSLNNVYGKLQSEWINIPLVYAENWNMVKSLIPLVIIAGVSAALSIAADQLDAIGIGLLTQPNPISPDVSSFHLDPTTIGFSPQLVDVARTTNTIVDEFFALLNFDITEEQAFAVDVLIESFSLLVLIRLAKIIGSDRDKIIASKIMKICEEFPGSDVVVVIGMLHCNGVAKYLLSGVDPLALSTTPSANSTAE